VNIIDLFCGAGGLSYGFILEGFNPIAAFDNDLDCVNHYNWNIGNHAIETEITKSLVKELPEVDGIIGGPPCQGFSLAGKRLENDPRSDLSIVFANIVNEMEPEWFVMENVGGLLSSTYKLRIEENLRKKFNVTPFLINAVDYGVAQLRKRLFFVGTLKGTKSLGLLDQPKPKEFRKTVADVLPDYEYEWYYRHPYSYGRRAVYSVREPSATIRTVNRPMPKTYKRHKNDAPYIAGQVRALTSEERAIIQSFPPSFKWHGTKYKKEKMIGNAVPPLMATVIARVIKRREQPYNSE